jgi:hypothetical protein
VRIFAADPREYRDAYKEHGWVHIKNGMTPEFVAELRRYVANSMQAGGGDERFAFRGKKEQVVYDFGTRFDDYPGELYDFVSTLCGLNRASITLSERHFQVYDGNANPEPAAHKDRFGSQVSMGFSVDIPQASTLVLYPHEHREVNPLNSSVAYRNSLRPHELPEVALADATELELNDETGDIVLFPGSSTWHLRRRSAGAVNLYCKFNDFNCDPLGEDPFTPRTRERSLELLRHIGGNGNGVVAVPARRFDKAECVYTRSSGRKLYQANLWGEDPFPLTESEFLQLQAIVAGEGGGRLPASVRELVERGALDLVPTA